MTPTVPPTKTPTPLKTPTAPPTGTPTAPPTATPSTTPTPWQQGCLDGWTQVLYLEEEFDTVPPSGWTITDNPMSACSWQSGTIAGNPNNTGGTGNFADADRAACGGALMSELRSPELDFSLNENPWVEFKTDMNVTNGAMCRVYAIIEETTWWELTAINYSMRGPRTITLPLYGAAWEDEVQVSFEYFASDSDGWWQIDDVRLYGCQLILTTPTPPPSPTPTSQPPSPTPTSQPPSPTPTPYVSTTTTTTATTTTTTTTITTTSSTTSTTTTVTTTTTTTTTAASTPTPTASPTAPDTPAPTGTPTPAPYCAAALMVEGVEDAWIEIPRSGQSLGWQYTFVPAVDPISGTSMGNVADNRNLFNDGGTLPEDEGLAVRLDSFNPHTGSILAGDTLNLTYTFSGSGTPQNLPLLLPPMSWSSQTQVVFYYSGTGEPYSDRWLCHSLLPAGTPPTPTPTCSVSVPTPTPPLTTTTTESTTTITTTTTISTTTTAAGESGAVIGDYNGDGTSDIAIFRASSGAWMVRSLTRVWFGAASDQPVPRDYSGDGAWDFAIYRPSLGKWMVRGLTSAFYGVATDVPVPGDYDGDGASDIALFRPSIGKWLVRSGLQAYYGFAADTVVPGDYNGDGTTDIAVFRPSIGKWLVRGGTQVYYGVATDTVVPGDYTGDGSCDFAVWRETNGVWLVKNGPHVYWGTSGDVVQPADYDGDGTMDFAVWRPASSRWIIYNFVNYYYGAPTDEPVTNP